MRNRERLAKVLTDRLGDQAGGAALDALRESFGGDSVYIPIRSPNDRARARRALDAGRDLREVAAEFAISTRTARRWRRSTEDR